MTDDAQVIRTLYEIAADLKQGFPDQIRRILKLCLERFNLDIGILAQITGDDYAVVHCVAPDTMPLKDGDRFSLKDTYCSMTMKADGPVWFEHAGSSDEVCRHPAYRSLQLESYAGIPIRIDGKVFGTLNFSSPDVRPRLFAPEDIDILRLVSSWVAAEIFRSRREDELKAAARQAKSLPGMIPICSCCKKIKSDAGSWDRMEAYFERKVDAEFSHDICPACVKTHYPQLSGDSPTG